MGMQIGQPVTISVDALHRHKLTGHVKRLSPATSLEFAVIKPDTTTGNLVKIAQRFSVRIAINPGQLLAADLPYEKSEVVK